MQLSIMLDCIAEVMQGMTYCDSSHSKFPKGAISRAVDGVSLVEFNCSNLILILERYGDEITFAFFKLSEDSMAVAGTEIFALSFLHAKILAFGARLERFDPTKKTKFIPFG